MEPSRTARKTPSDAAEEQRESGADAPVTRAGKVRLRSLDELDQRTAAARRARDLVAELKSDLGGDLSTAQRELVKRAALLGAILEDHEVRWLQREPADPARPGLRVVSCCARSPLGTPLRLPHRS
jgi:hypothetical protein